MHGKENNKKEDWENAEELVGSSKKLSVKLLASGNNVFGIRLIGDKRTVDYNLSYPFTTTPPATTPTEIPAFNVTFQLPRNRKSRLPYHMPSFEINLGVFEAHPEKARK